MNELEAIIAEMRAWATGDGCFNDAPDGEPLPCVYWAQQPFLALCDRLEDAYRATQVGEVEPVVYSGDLPGHKTMPGFITPERMGALHKAIGHPSSPAGDWRQWISVVECPSMPAGFVQVRQNVKVIGVFQIEPQPPGQEKG